MLGTTILHTFTKKKTCSKIQDNDMEDKNNPSKGYFLPKQINPRLII
jgi:hypothetical protein